MILLRTIYIILILIMVTGCTLKSNPPSSFPQFSAYSIAGPGEYQLPQWSPDSRYLAFLDVSAEPILVVYDTETQEINNIATNISSRGFGWRPDGSLTYYQYRPDLSGKPFPSISELYSVDIDGQNNQLIAGNFQSAGDIAWLSNGQEFIILLSEVNPSSYCQEAYVLNIGTGEKRLLVSNAELGVDCLTMIALSPNETSLLAVGVREENGVYEEWFSVYDIENQLITGKYMPSKIIPADDITYPIPAISDDANLGWVGGDQWILTAVNTPSGECYNYSLFFFNINALDKSFCITSSGVFAAPVISPDLSKISYITVLGPGNNYLMIGDIPHTILDQLEFKN